MQAMFKGITYGITQLSKIPNYSKVLNKCISPAAIASGNLPTSFIPASRSFGILSNVSNSFTQGNELLKPVSTLFTQTCGLKIRGVLKRRCRHCFFVWRQETLYVMCKAKPRHKQVQMKTKPHNEYILTHATQHKIRPW